MFFHQWINLFVVIFPVFVKHGQFLQPFGLAVFIKQTVPEIKVKIKEFLVSDTLTNPRSCQSLFQVLLKLFHFLFWDQSLLFVLLLKVMNVQVCKHTQNLKYALFSQHLPDSRLNYNFMLKLITVSHPEQNCILIVEFISVRLVRLWGLFVVLVKSKQKRRDSVLVVLMQPLRH